MRTLKGRTQITPNLLCRLGFAMSLEEAGNPPPIQLEGDEVGREINRNTLLGNMSLSSSLYLRNGCMSTA